MFINNFFKFFLIQIARLIERFVMLFVRLIVLFLIHMLHKILMLQVQSRYAGL